MSIVFFDAELDRSTALSNINLAAFTWDAVYTLFLYSDPPSYPVTDPPNGSCDFKPNFSHTISYPSFILLTSTCL